MRLSWRVVPTIGGLALAGACADTPASPLREQLPIEAAAVLIDADRASEIAAGLADVETRVLPTLGDEATALRSAVAVLHGALDRRDARALARGISPVLDAARALAAHRPDAAFELEPLTLSLGRLAAELPAALRGDGDDYSITRGER